MASDSDCDSDGDFAFRLSASIRGKKKRQTLKDVATVESEIAATVESEIAATAESETAGWGCDGDAGESCFYSSACALATDSGCAAVDLCTHKLSAKMQVRTCGVQKKKTLEAKIRAIVNRLL